VVGKGSQRLLKTCPEGRDKHRALKAEKAVEVHSSAPQRPFLFLALKMRKTAHKQGEQYNQRSL
jgi:hypothetical protein